MTDAAPVGLDLDALRELLAKATPGPWVREANDRSSAVIAGYEDIGLTVVARVPLHNANADLIVAAVNALGALLDLVSRQQAVLVDLEWAGYGTGDETLCPSCWGEIKGGHVEGCALRSLLSRETQMSAPIKIDPNQQPYSLCRPRDLPFGTVPGSKVAVILDMDGDEDEGREVGTATVISVGIHVVRLLTDWQSFRSPALPREPQT